MQGELWEYEGRPHRAAEELLGDPEQSDNPFSYARLAEYDREEAFPAEPCRILNGAGLSKQYVPAGHGGALTGYDGLLRMWRAVAGRDLTVAIGHGKTFLGGICTWLAGSTEQVSSLAREIASDTVVSWGLTERDHGADLLSGELSADKFDGSWALNGEKWLINNATRGDMICVLARTDPKGGPRGFTLFMVDKRTLPQSSYYFLPKERTYGIRGADISGIGFEDARIPDEARIGAVGSGLEITLKALQITRTVVAGLSLGAADHGLRLVREFAHGHEMYHRKLIELPLVRHNLGESIAAIFVGEVTGLVASRSIHALTGEMSVLSAITKALVPTLIDDTIAKLAEQLGARSFLTHEYADGAFQKLERDSRLIAIFDGSTVVNRNALIDQFRVLARCFAAGTWDEGGVKEATTLDKSLGEMDYSRLSLLSHSGCSIVQSLSQALDDLEQAGGSGLLPNTFGDLIDVLRTSLAETVNQMAQYRPSPRAVPSEVFEVASRYELLFAAGACLHVWFNNSERQNSPLWTEGLWLEACLTYIVARLRPDVSPAEKDVYQRLYFAAESGGRRGATSLFGANTSGEQ